MVTRSEMPRAIEKLVSEEVCRQRLKPQFILQYLRRG